MLDRVPRRTWGLSGRLIASYILVTLAVVVLVEALVLGFQVPALVNGAQLQVQVNAAGRTYAGQLSERYPGGLPAGIVLGEGGQIVQPGLARSAPDGTLVVPKITGPIKSDQAITAVIAVSAEGTVIASSAPFRYRPGRTAASELPDPASEAIAFGLGRMALKHGSLATPYGSVLWTVEAASGPGIGQSAASARRRVAYVYVQAPWSPRFISPSAPGATCVSSARTASFSPVP